MFLSLLIKKIPLAFIVALVFFVLPFFWFQRGSMDLGGDGNRLYFYDPVAFIKNISLYSMTPEGKSSVDPTKHAYLPYVSMLALLKLFHISTHDLINLFNGIKLGVGFISIYLIVKEFLQRSAKKERKIYVIELPAMLAGIFYVFAMGSEKLIFLWVKALHSHDQVFLNPLVFFLLLRYLLTRNGWYLWSFLFVSFVFSTSFAMISAPPFFAFYPIALAFLLLYVVLIRKIKIQLKEIVIGLFLYLGLHAFHLIPELLAVFYNNTVATFAVFNESGVNYFTAVRGLGLAVVSLFVPSPVTSLRWTSFVAPLVIILGCFQSWKKNNEIVLISIFFFVTFFLVTANITYIGVEFYKRLFLFPAFSMFRNFYSQWAYVFIFFFALLFGESLALIFKKLRVKYIKLAAFCMVILFIIGFLPFLSGQLVDGIHWGSNGVKTAMIIDPRYELMLAFIKKLPNEGKILMFPLTDNFNQVVYGLNDAAYVGPSSISILTHKKSFTGYQIFYPNPIPETIMRLSREKNYEALTQIFSLFNIRYIYHNTDPKIYEEKFPIFPNQYMMTSMPKTQEEYKEFVRKFPVRPIYENGPFQMFEFDDKVYRSEIYIPDSIYVGDMLEKIEDKNVSFRSAFIDPIECKQSKIISDFCNTEYDTPKVYLSMNKVNPIQYTIRVSQSGSTAPFLLVFQNSYHKGWKLSVDDNTPLGEDRHVLVNKYANSWIISESDRKGKTEYTISLSLDTQKYFIYGLWITGFSLVVFMSFILRTILHDRRK